MLTEDEISSRNNILNINIGILGHVDSGKTSLVKALSTCLSTAALDKHPQSQARGITLDLGFSAFSLPIPDRLACDTYDVLQFTLVDCPGHASLIRTIIGGAQIIDMIILVVDANKGIQTQTAECIVIGEITTDDMIIVLNKVDMIPPEEREEKITKVIRRIRRVLNNSKFANAPIIPISAAVGGEKAAALSSSTTNNKAFKSNVDSDGVDRLISLVQETVKLPHRNIDAPFYYAIDHCFPIKGHGTVLTGTILSGAIAINQTIELPHLKQQRKVKSMQMFRKPVKNARQGDRVAICVTNIDSKLIERSIAATPSTLPLLSSVIAMVKKIRFFRMSCRSNSKFHISIGHSTVVANVVFFGGNEWRTAMEIVSQLKANHTINTATIPGLVDSLQEKMSQTVRKLVESILASEVSHTTDTSTQATALNGQYLKSFPYANIHHGYPWELDFEYQDEILSTDDVNSENNQINTSTNISTKSIDEPMQYAFIQLQHPVYCPLGSLLIGSRLDADVHDSSSTSAQQCRLAFYGPIISSTTSQELQQRSRVFTWKQKISEVSQVIDINKHTKACTEAIGWKLASDGSSLRAFLGMKVLTEDKRSSGDIISSYGAEGQFRVKFSKGAILVVGDKLVLPYKKFVFDKSRPIEQDSLLVTAVPSAAEEGEDGYLDLLVDDTSLLVDQLPSEVQIKEDLLTASKVKQPIESSSITTQESKNTPNNTNNTNNNNKPKKRQQQQQHDEQNTTIPTTPNTLPIAPTIDINVINNNLSSISINNDNHPRKVEEVKTISVVTTNLPLRRPIAPTIEAHSSAGTTHDGELRIGKLESLKNELSTELFEQGIVSGAFRMEENVKWYVGSIVVGPNQEEGVVTTAFGKLGKCRVSFPHGCKLTAVNQDVRIYAKKTSSS